MFHDPAKDSFLRRIFHNLEFIFGLHTDQSCTVILCSRGLWWSPCGGNSYTILNFVGDYDEKHNIVLLVLGELLIRVDNAHFLVCIHINI
jgi:hypothetical protein